MYIVRGTPYLSAWYEYVVPGGTKYYLQVYYVHICTMYISRYLHVHMFIVLCTKSTLYTYVVRVSSYEVLTQ